jgi:hypothetical protein
MDPAACTALQTQAPRSKRFAGDFTPIAPSLARRYVLLPQLTLLADLVFPRHRPRSANFHPYALVEAGDKDTYRDHYVPRSRSLTHSQRGTVPMTHSLNRSRAPPAPARTVASHGEAQTGATMAENTKVCTLGSPLVFVLAHLLANPAHGRSITRRRSQARVHPLHLPGAHRLVRHCLLHRHVVPLRHYNVFACDMDAPEDVSDDGRRRECRMRCRVVRGSTSQVVRTLWDETPRQISRARVECRV